MRFWTAAAVAAYFLYFFRLAGMGLIGPDEPRYAAIGREMTRSGDWVTPRLWGEPWFEKPALLYWTTAAAFRAGLGDDWAPRLPVACLSVLFLLFFYSRMKAEFGSPAAGYGTAVLATSGGWVAYSHAAIFDLPLGATFGGAMLCLLAYLERREGRWLIGFAALLGLAALAKGLVGPALALLVVLGWQARMRDGAWRALLRPAPALAFAAVAVPWYALCYARNGPVFLREFFWKHHFARYAAGALEHNQPVWYFLPVLAVGLLPWTPLVLAFEWRDLWQQRRAFFLACWAAVTLVFFSVSRDKLPAYILPALPALAALAGVALSRQRPMQMALTLCALALGLAPAAAAVLPVALDSGLGAALGYVRVPLLPLVVAAAVTASVWLLERARRRPAAVAITALSAVAAYAWIKQSTFPAIDQRAGTRTLWQKVVAHRDAVCLGDTPRRVAYGLNYYAGRSLPSCEDAPKPYRIEEREIISGL